MSAACAAPSFLVRGFFVGAELSSATSRGAAAAAAAAAPAPGTGGARDGSSTLFEGLVSVLVLGVGVVVDVVAPALALEDAAAHLGGAPVPGPACWPAPAGPMRSYASRSGPESASEPTMSKHTVCTVKHCYPAMDMVLVAYDEMNRLTEQMLTPYDVM